MGPLELIRSPSQQLVDLTDQLKLARPGGAKFQRPNLAIPDAGPLRRTASSLMASLPVEVVRMIVGNLCFVEIARLRVVSKAFLHLCSAPAFFRELDLTEVAHCFDLPPALRKHARRLVLHSSDATTAQLSKFMASGDHFVDLVSLDLSFCAANELLFDSLSVRARSQLRHLTMQGCRQVKDGVWLAELLPFLETLDVSWSGLRTLPGGERKAGSAVLLDATMDGDDAGDVSLWSDDTLVDEEASAVANAGTVAWPRLKRLDLAGCGHLLRESLTLFLSEELPPSLVSLRLAWHTPLSLDIDSAATLLPRAIGPNRSFQLDVRRCDAVTLAHVAEIQRHTHIAVQHTAVLENESLASYRKYIELLSVSFMAD